MSPNQRLSDAAIRRAADQVVDQFPNDPLEILAADMLSESYAVDGLDIALAITAELLRRASSGVRKWPIPAKQENAADEFERKLAVEMDRILSGAEMKAADLVPGVQRGQDEA